MFGVLQKRRAKIVATAARAGVSVAPVCFRYVLWWEVITTLFFVASNIIAAAVVFVVSLEDASLRRFNLCY